MSPEGKLTQCRWRQMEGKETEKRPADRWIDRHVDEYTRGGRGVRAR